MTLPPPVGQEAAVLGILSSKDSHYEVYPTFPSFYVY